MKITFETATVDNAFEITELLNTVTLQLHHKSIMQWEYPWDQNSIENDVLSNLVEMLLDNGRIIATFSISPLRSNPWASENLVDALYMYHIAIHPDYQGYGIGKQIMQHATGFGLAQKKNIYLDCWAGNTKLKNFYTESGFEYIGDFPEKDYRISAFCFYCRL